VTVTLDVDRILVPVSGQGGWESAITLACTLGKGPESTIHVVYVIELERSTSLDAEIESKIKKAEQVLDEARDMAAKGNCEVETSILQAREAGPAIVEEAVDRETSLILMGMRYKKRFGDFTLGEVAPHVLKYAPCPVLIVREAPLQDSPA
jgi:nucleotide-binding universal stress UspA family protein